MAGRYKVLERDVVRAIFDYCAAERIFIERRNVAALKIGNRFIRCAKPGQADAWGIMKGGRHFECEIKRPGEEPSDEQREWLQRCADAGALAFWADSLDVFIEHIGNGH